VDKSKEAYKKEMKKVQRFLDAKQRKKTKGEGGTPTEERKRPE